MICSRKQEPETCAPVLMLGGKHLCSLSGITVGVYGMDFCLDSTTEAQDAQIACFVSNSVCAWMCLCAHVFGNQGQYLPCVFLNYSLFYLLIY